MAKGRILILIGPTGGFTREGVKLFDAKGAQIVSFGDIVLRTPTAAAYCLSAVRFFYE